MSTQRISRRRFLGTLGVGTVVLVSGGGVWRAVDQGVFSSAQGPAYTAWETWRTDMGEGPMALVRAGILAASPHNTQPWLFRITDTSIELFADTQRHLGAMDPYLREMHIGLGCAIENMMLTAQAIGYDVNLTLETGTLTGLTDALEPQLVATFALSEGASTPDELYEAIPNRHTDRAAYDMSRPLSDEMLTNMRELADDEPDIVVMFFSQGDDAYTRVVEGTVRGTEMIIADEVMSHDSHKWFRHSWSEVQEHKDGPFIDTAGVPPLLRGVVKMLPPMAVDTIDSNWLSATQSTLDATPVVGFIAVRDLYDQVQSVNAGRVWQRMHLWATTQGLSMHPINQMPEIVDRERQLDQPAQMAEFFDGITQDPAWRPTFAFRLGYPTMSLLPSARRPVEEVTV